MGPDKRIVLCLLMFFASLYFMFSIGHFGGDGYQDYLTAESIVMDGNLALYDRPGDKDDLGYLDQLGVTGRDGRTYSSRNAIGISFILVPFYFVGHVMSKVFKGIPHDYVTMLCVSFANPVVSALNCMMVFLIGRRLNFTAGVACVISLIYGLSTMTPVYIRTGFSEPSVVLFLLFSVYVLLLYRESFRSRYLALTAFFLACMFFCKAVALIFAPCFLFFVVWVLKDAGISFGEKVRHIFIFLAVYGLLFGTLLTVNYQIYGSILSFGKIHAVEMGKRIVTAPHMLKGVYYYLLSTGKGFFVFNIPVVLSLFSVKRAMKQDKKMAVFFLLIFAVNLLFYVKSFRRGSLFNWGPRYLMPSVPLGVMFLGYYFEEFKGVLSRYILGVFSIVGFLVVLPCMFINQSKFYLFVVEKLGLDEYMINFIPDLSPIKGAWSMFSSRIIEILGGSPAPFVYMPDYRLVKPIGASMAQYNYVDMWFVKVLQMVPAFAPLVWGGVIIMAAVAIFSIYKMIVGR